MFFLERKQTKSKTQNNYVKESQVKWKSKREEKKITTTNMQIICYLFPFLHHHNMITIMIVRLIVRVVRNKIK